MNHCALEFSLACKNRPGAQLHLFLPWSLSCPSRKSEGWPGCFFWGSGSPDFYSLWPVLLILGPTCWGCRDPPCVLQVLVPEMAAWRQRIQLLHGSLSARSPLRLHGLTGPGACCPVSGRGGLPTGPGAVGEQKEGSLSPGGEQAIRNGWWPPKMGGRGRSGAPASPLWCGLSAAQVLALLLWKLSFHSHFLHPSLEPASAPPACSFLASNRHLAVGVTWPFASLLSWLCLRQRQLET